MRRRKSKLEGSFIVTGPHETEKHAPTLGAALSLAQNYATKRRRDEGSYTYYVRDILGTTTYASVTKEEDGSITTVPAILAA